jgi:hypothetical protein
MLEVKLAMEKCELFSPEEIETFKKTRELYLCDVVRVTGFAEAFSTFGKITELETSIPKLICTSRVPPRETRKLLRCRDPLQASNVPVYQFMRNLFNQIGFELSVIKIMPFMIIFRIKPPIYESPTKQKKTCYTTAEAIFRFMAKDLGLKCEVEEVRCINEGELYCDFRCSLEFMSACNVALDENDKKLFDLISMGMGPDELLKEGYDENEEALKFRLEILKDYNLIDDNLKLTEKGKEFHDFLLSNPKKEEDFEPPWNRAKDITSTTSTAASFAEALKETSTKKKPEGKK